MNRPEYIRCILRGPEGPNHSGETWCGRSIVMEWAFCDVNHAAKNGAEQGRLVACKDCVKVIHEALLNGWEL